MLFTDNQVVVKQIVVLTCDKGKLEIECRISSADAPEEAAGRNKTNKRMKVKL